MHIKFIVNPISGTRSKQGLVEKLTLRLTEMGFDVDTELTKGHGDATRIAREAVRQGYDGVLACGGDGTVNETACAMIDTGVPMGIIPAGSGNGLARHMAIPIDPMLSLEIINARHIVDCDYCTANGMPFFCTFGLGFDAAVSDRFAESGKRGKATYIKSALKEFVHYDADRYTLTLDDGQTIERDAFLVTCCNASQFGNNAYIAPHASITDGLMDIIIVPDVWRLRMLPLGLDLMTGVLDNNNLAEVYRVRRARLTRARGGAAHLDGEPVKVANDVDLEVHPGGLRMFASPDKTPFKPLLTPIEALIQDLRISFGRLFH